MTISELTKLLESGQKEIKQLFRRKLPIQVGRIARNHYQDNFRKEGFVNGGLHLWEPSKRKLRGTGSAGSRYKTLLSSRRHLFSSIKYMPSEYKVKVANDLKYAPVHNWGGDLSIRVTPKMRKFAWAKFYEEKKEKKKTVEVKSMWKGLALTKKSTLKVKIPQRQFLGDSKELTARINNKIDTELTNILKP